MDGQPVHEWAFVGRDALLARVRTLVSTGRSTVLTGPAGSGKSRLLWEVARSLEDDGITPIRLVATATAASIPFAALGPILTVEARGLAPIDLLALARSGLRERSTAGPVVLLVDDAPRLDAGSATFVHQVLVEAMCPVIATARDDEVSSETIAPVLGEPSVEVLDLQPLGPDEVTVLVEQVLGGQCGAGVVHALGSASDGNPLLLRELIRHGITTGLLAETNGVWRLLDELSAPPGLSQLVESHLAGLNPSSRQAMEILACAERIDVDQLGRLVSDDDLEQLESSGLARTELADGRMLVTLVHPLYGEAVRNALSPLRRRRIATALADVVEGAGFPSPGAVMRVVQWRLDANVDVDPALITHAAREAWMASDFALAEHLAGAARKRGGGFDAGLIVGESAMFVGEHERAEAVMAELAGMDLTGEERARLANARAFNLAQNLDRESDALAVIDEALAVLDDGATGDMLRGRAVAIHALAPRPSRAVELAAPVLARPDSDEFHRVAYASAIALATVGRLHDAVELGAAGFAAHDRLRDVARQLPESQHVGPVLALVALGRFDAASELATAGRDRSAASFDAESQATFALLDGVVATAAGRVVDAARAFREAAAINTDIGDHVALRWSLGGVCLAAAMAGDRSGAASAVSHLDALGPSSVRLLDAMLVDRGRAWERAARGDVSGAAQVLRAAIDDAVATEQHTAAVLLLHDLVCIDGRADDATRLAGVARFVDGDLVAARVAHATAIAARDADMLESVAGRFAGLGANIEAAVAASHAARELAATGLDRRARAMEALAATALAACQGAAPPLQVERAAPVELTRREREIAMLAADGCTNREISEQLYLSVRTVENHLQRAYEKLGVTSRAELTCALGGQARARGISSTDR